MKKKPVSNLSKVIVAIVAVCVLVAAVIISRTRPTTRPQNKTSLADAGQEQAARAQKRFDALMATHPDEGIKRDLNRLLVWEGHGFYQFRPIRDIPGALGVFSVVDFEGRMVPVFEINSEALLNPNLSDKKMQLVIFHEYQHMLDYLKGVDPPEMYMQTVFAEITEAKMKRIYDGEMRAYLAQCRLAVQVHWENEFSLCRDFAVGGERILRRNVAIGMSRNPVFGKHSDFLLRIAQEN